MKTTALAPWFGSNRMLAHKVGELLAGCEWVGVPFAGGMCELAHIKARTILVGDLHRHVINLARVIADDFLRPQLVKRLRRLTFHPDELDEAQERCKADNLRLSPDLSAAFDYFVSVWMGRSHVAGTKDEFHGRLSTRWNATGGDSNVRFRSAVRAIAAFSLTARRCTFGVMDAFEFIPRCEDREGHGIYCDPPFYGAGRAYRHNGGATEAEELAWHARLRDVLVPFTRTRVVIRFYDHPVVRKLYPAAHWHYHRLTGRKQSNEAAPELLLTNHAVPTGLF